MVSENLVKHSVRAKFFRQPNGCMKLAQIQQLSLPAFKLPGYELIGEYFDEAAAIPTPEEVGTEDEPGGGDPLYLLRNLRRAKIAAFDKICANPDLDTFATFTLSPDAVGDRASWEDCYRCLRGWLCNRVNRRGLKYVIAPERHKAGGIHFHAIMNAAALRLSPAISPKTGQPLTNHGAPLYNVTDWKFGFTSAERIQSADTDREHVAKYIFKYMGKQGITGKIGGRYLLTGGALALPVYAYGDNPAEFMPDTAATYSREVEHDGGTYREWCYI